jgi:hypothetical protein
MAEVVSGACGLRRIRHRPAPLLAAELGRNGGGAVVGEPAHCSSVCKHCRSFLFDCCARFLPYHILLFKCQAHSSHTRKGRSIRQRRSDMTANISLTNCNPSALIQHLSPTLIPTSPQHTIPSTPPRVSSLISCSCSFLLLFLYLSVSHSTSAISLSYLFPLILKPHPF